MKKVKMKVWFSNVIAMLVLIFFLAMFWVLLVIEKNSPVNNLRYDCVVYTVEDLNRCYEEHQYVVVHAIEVLDAGYERLEDDKETARFVIVNVDGHGMVSLLKESLANKLFDNKTGHIIIRGRLEKFTKSAGKITESVEREYKEAFHDLHTEEELETLFTSIQLNQYEGNKGDLITQILIYLALCGVFLWLIIKRIPTIIVPNNYYLNNYISLKDEVKVQKILEEMVNCHYHYKGFYITENFLVVKKGTKFQVADKDCIAWIYEKKSSINFIQVADEIVVYSFDRKKTLHIPAYGHNGEPIMNILMREYPNATFGYNAKLSRLWKLNPQSFIRK